ncbi:MAG: conjugal transfer protein TraF [Armatimonadota bacterium]
MSMSFVRRLLLLSCCLALALPIMADITLGGNARSVAMGGAGLAADDSPAAATVNPAALASTGPRIGVQLPTVNAGTEGLGFSDAFNLLSKATVDPDQALDYALTLGEKLTNLSSTVDAGLLLPYSDVRMNAALRTEVRPNESFKQWLASGANGEVPADARADIRAGAVTTLPSVGVGFHLPFGQSLGRMAVGVRLKPTQTYYSHYVVDAASLQSNTAVPDPEMGGASYRKQSSVSADLGFLFTPRALPNARLGLVVNNALEPAAIRLPTQTDGVLTRQIAPRTVSAGAAYVTDYLVLAADVVDITKAVGNPQLRLGAELRGNTGVALRGGYGSDTGFTAGVGYGNLGIAFTQNTPIMLTQSITF